MVRGSRCHSQHSLPHLIVYCSFILLGSLMACNPWQTHSGKYVLAKKDQWTNEHSVTVEGKSYVLPGYVNTQAQMCTGTEVWVCYNACVFMLVLLIEKL